jgi:hypothetical protein
MRLAIQSFIRAALVASLGLTGCSPTASMVRRPETGATLEGKVSYGDQKVAVGLVIVQNDSGMAQGFIDDEGRYKLENVPIGEVNIAVNTDAGKGQLMSRAMSQSKGKAKGLPKVVELPAKFQNPGQSGLKTTVNKGPNEYNIVIPK